jgi:hypothetical protein
MKALIAALALLSVTPAFAGEQLMSAKYDGTMLTYSYQTGGGCEDHVPKVTVPTIAITQDTGFKIADLKIDIQDTTKSGREDNCRAIIFVNGRVNLTELAAATLKENGIDPKTEIVKINVQLPAVDVQL